MSALKNRDYREFEKTLVGFLDAKEDGAAEKNIKCISNSVEEISDLNESKTYVKEFVKCHICSDKLSVSNTYYRKFCYVVDTISNKNELLKYLYNIYLCGRGLSVASARK